MATVLRPYQNIMKADIYSAWEQSYKNVLLVMPTGAGKTRTFCSIAIEVAIGRGIPTAIKVHRKELVSQIAMTLAEEGIPHNIIAPSNVIKGIIAAQRMHLKKQFYDYKAPVTVISVDTLNARIERHRKWADGIGFWIVDEAAHVQEKNKWGRAASYFPNAFGLGVTATPERLDRGGLGRGHGGIFDVMIEGPPTQWLIKKGFLSNYMVVAPKGDYRDHLKESSGDSDYSAAAREEASLKSHIVGDVVKNYKIHAMGKQCIVFADSIVAATRMEAEFLKQGITAKLLTGDTPDPERIQALIDYRNRKIRVLLNVDLFDEGLDVPGIECVSMARPTKSLGKFLQMVGRGLRKAEGKPYLILIDHVGNLKEHGLPDDIREWTLERRVSSRDKVNSIRICKNETCNKVFERYLSTCPYCGHKDERPSGDGGGRPALDQIDGDLVLLHPDQIREMEGAARLEDPGSVAARVSKTQPAGIAKAAMERQRERIEAQGRLKDAVAKWAGVYRNVYNQTDRWIHKKFYAEHGMTITMSLAQSRQQMDDLAQELMYEIGRSSTVRNSSRWG